jgi:pimeloyl-ACP methyl ester carboxylesterase
MVTFGRSLGGAVAVSLAHRHPDLVAGVIMENTFLSVGAMVDVLMPFLRHIRHLVLTMNWGSDVKVAELKMPLLFISGTHRLSLYLVRDCVCRVRLSLGCLSATVAPRDCSLFDRV